VPSCAAPCWRDRGRVGHDVEVSLNRRSSPAVLLLLAAALVVSACTTSKSGHEPAAVTASQPAVTTSGAASPATGRSAHLRVMSFNIENGGTGVAFSSVSKAIEAAHADVVAVNEGYGNIPRLARALHWPYYDIGTQIVSRLPLIAPPANDRFRFPPGAHTTDGRAMFVEVSPGRVVAVINVHLPSTPYSPFKVQQGATAHQIRVLERHERVSALKRPLRTARRLIGQHVPTFLLGDFNSPSDLDWTRATVGLRDQVKYPFRWPASAAVEASGMVDSYRSVHPNPVTDPGLTWPASRPFVKGYNPGPAGQAADRIDLLFSGGPARATSSQVVGERGSAANIVVSPWPSDHRAVVSGFTVTAAPEPALVSVRARLVERGAAVSVDYSAPKSDARSIVVRASRPGRGRPERVAVQAARSGTVRIDTGQLEPGEYHAVLIGSDGPLHARMAFWVEKPGASTVLRTSRPSYERGHGVPVSWSDAPGDRNDWLAVYRRGAVPGKASYLGWTYIGPQVAGSTVVNAAIRGVSRPLAKGRYTAYLLKDDGYDVLAHADFRVR
jgi:endonuclease/exonuclease/phosphatase family metal-dependent hydrolase